ncbi:glutamine amidotransferase-related protein, partial [Staphylococcus arlettae]
DSLYEIPLQLSQQEMDDIVINRLELTPKYDTQLDEWQFLLDTVNSLDGTITIGLVGKYVSLQDAYLSVVESLKHAGYPFKKDINVKWIDSSEVTTDNVADYLGEVDGILVPGGFGFRASEGKIAAIQYARENNVPYFGICLGMQLATVEFARNVLGLEGAHSAELDPNTPHPIIDL